jgi:hypothetical protein
MATRKTTDNPAAREHAENMLDGAMARREPGDETPQVAVFEAAEFETASSRVGGTDITLRRVVLTGPWEVAPK